MLTPPLVSRYQQCKERRAVPSAQRPEVATGEGIDEGELFTVCGTGMSHLAHDRPQGRSQCGTKQNH
ncbi:hypothetical protein J6590_048039 [Homalodisca vitripennis]|nr:hypothetical protein J6590_048039 [Homalodisca vitripennis]